MVNRRLLRKFLTEYANKNSISLLCSRTARRLFVQLKGIGEFETKKILKPLKNIEI